MIYSVREAAERPPNGGRTDAGKGIGNAEARSLSKGEMIKPAVRPYYVRAFAMSRCATHIFSEICGIQTFCDCNYCRRGQLHVPLESGIGPESDRNLNGIVEERNEIIFTQNFFEPIRASKTAYPVNARKIK